MDSKEFEERRVIVAKHTDAVPSAMRTIEVQRVALPPEEGKEESDDELEETTIVTKTIVQWRKADADAMLSELATLDG